MEDLSFICQMKNGVMLAEESGRHLKLVKTGYPYPDTPRSNVEMLQDLLRMEVGADKPEEFFVDYVEAINTYIELCKLHNSHATSHGLAEYLIRHERLGSIKHDYLVAYSDGYNVIMTNVLFSDMVVITNVDFLKAEGIEADYSLNLWEKLSTSIAKYMLNSSDLLNLGTNDVKLMLDMFLKKYSLDLLYNMNLFIEDFCVLMTRYFTACDIERFYRHVARRMSSDNKSHIKITSECVGKLAEYVTDGDIFKYISPKHTIVIAFSYVFRTAKVKTKVKYFAAKSKLTDEYPISTSNSFVSNLAKGLQTKLHDVEKVSYENGNFFIDISDKVGDTLDLSIFYGYVNFRSSLTDIIYNPESVLGISPSSVSNSKIVWNMTKYFDSKTAPIVMLIYSSVKLIPFSSLTTLTDSDILDILSDISGIDNRVLIFDTKGYRELHAKFIYHMNIYDNSSDRFELFYYDYIPDEIINILGNFSLFARLFCYGKVSEYFKFNEKLKDYKFSNGKTVTYYAYNIGYSRFNNEDEVFNMSNETFENTFKGACIADMLKLLLGDEDLCNLSLLSIDNVRIKFNEKRQRVIMSYSY